MKTIILFFFITLSSLGCVDRESTITTFILVRHAEKENDGTNDPDLKPEGVTRANRLAQMMKNSNINGIYSTDLKRSRNTVSPLVAATGNTLQLYESFKAEEIERMLKNHAAGTILVCGHSNNIPWIANLLIGKEEFKDFKDDEYGTMLIVSVVEKGKVAKVTRINW